MDETRMSIVRDEDPRLQHCLLHIEQYKKPTRDEDLGLAERIHDGDRDALDKLVNANLSHVVGIAKEFHHHGLGDLDLIAEGNVGLISAARNFDGSRGIRFISFAKLWIGRAIRRTVVVHVRASRPPPVPKRRSTHLGAGARIDASSETVADGGRWC